jgi:hypothetical protein
MLLAQLTIDKGRLIFDLVTKDNVFHIKSHKFKIQIKFFVNIYKI